MAQRKTFYGGQAVMEGVMIRGPRSMAIACRRPDGGIATKSDPLTGVYTSVLRKVPFIRGVIVLWETMVLGIRSLIWSSQVQMGEEEKAGETPPGYLGSMLVMLVLIAAVFFAGPLLLANLLDDLLGNDTLVILVEGLIRLAIILAYVTLIGLIPEIRRVYEYHGAEHMTIHAMEHGDPLEPSAVHRYPTAHVRCGTSFLLTVIIVSVFVFAAVGNPDLWIRMASRVILIPAIASISYEVIRLGGMFENNPVTKVLLFPNLALQAITTKPPDDAQVEVAITALKEVLKVEQALDNESVAVPAALETAPPLD